MSIEQTEESPAPFFKFYTCEQGKNVTIANTKLSKMLIAILLSSFFWAQPMFAQNPSDLSEQIHGEWIMYRGDQFEIKRISEGQEQSSFYNWRGQPLYERSADLKIVSDAVGESRTLIGENATWQYLAGGKTPTDNSWTGLEFDATKQEWKTGEAGFGYGDNDDRTVLPDMRNWYTSVFIRKEFEIPQGADLKHLGMLIRYDDGFIVYANGQRLFTSSNLTEDPETGTVFVQDHEANHPEYFSLEEYARVFHTGKNVIAIEGHNRNFSSSDFTLDPQLMTGGSHSFIKSNQTVSHLSYVTDWFYKDRTWNGKVDDLRIWDRALSNDEVSALWNRGQGSDSISEKSTQGLIGYWPFDGNLQDVSGNERHGKGENSPGFAPGKLGQALNLNGDHQFVTLGGKASDYTPSSGSFTISCWFSVHKFDKRWQTLLAIGDNGWTDWRIHRHNLSRNISFHSGAGTRNNTNIDDGKMHHLVAVHEKGKEVRLYLDNLLSWNGGGANGMRNLQKDRDGWLPAVGANLQAWINAATPLEGNFIPMQDSLRIDTKPSSQNNGGANRFQSGVFRRVTHPEEALLIAAQQGQLEKVATLLKSGVDPDSTSTNSYTALAYAASRGHLDVMELLIANKANVNKAGRFFKTPLLVAVGSPHIDAVKLLISNGAKLNARQGQGASCLHEAAYWGQPKMVEFLLKEQHVDPNVRARNGQTALHHAMSSMISGQPEHNEPYMACLKLLLENGTNPDLRWNRWNALQMANSNGLDEAGKLFP